MSEKTPEPPIYSMSAQNPQTRQVQSTAQPVTGAAPGMAGPGAAPQGYQQAAPLNPQFTGGYPAQQPGLNPQFTGGAYPAQQPGAYPAQQPGAYPQPPPGGYPGYPQQGGYPQAPPGQYSQPQPWAQQAGPQEAGAPPVYHTAMPLMSLTLGSSPVDCPVCRKRALTRTEFQAGNSTHLWALIFCLTVGLGCIPYLTNYTKNVKHSCGNCGVHLATWNRNGHTVVYQHA